MKISKQQIKDFFSDYEKRFNNSLKGRKVNVKGTVDAFAEYFVEAHPAGVIAGKKDKKFESLIKKGNLKYKKIGTQSMTIDRLKIVDIDEIHAMVKITWNSLYKKDDSSQVRIEFDVSYFVQARKGKLKIFAYVTGDEQRALHEKGLI